MKKKQFKRFIAWGFTVLAVFLIASFSVPFRSFADTHSAIIHWHSYAFGTVFTVQKLTDGSWETYLSSSSNVSEDKTSSVGLSPGSYRVRNFSTSSSYTYSFYYYYNNSMLSRDSSNPTIISADSFTLTISPSSKTTDFFYFDVVDSATPTPEPTPTPTPTAPPTPTQDPTITSDIQFWGRVNTNANGFWQVLTQIFNGIFNNVVMRNMIVYIPLFGLIITLVVYLFTFGGRHD